MRHLPTAAVRAVTDGLVDSGLHGEAQRLIVTLTRSGLVKPRTARYLEMVTRHRTEAVAS